MYERDMHDFNCFYVLDLDPFKAYSDEEIINRIDERRKEWTGTLKSRSSESEEKVRARFLLDSIDTMRNRMMDPCLRNAEVEDAEKLIRKLSQSLNRCCIVTSDGSKYVFPGETYTLMSDIGWTSVDEMDFLSCADLKNEQPEICRHSKLIPTVKQILLCGTTSPSELFNRICDDLSELSGFKLLDSYDSTSFDKTLEACKKKLSHVQDSKYPMRDVYRQAVNSISSVSDRDERTKGIQELCKAWCTAELITRTMDAEKHMGVFGRTYVMDMVNCYADQIDDRELLVSVLLHLCYNNHIAVNMSSDDVVSLRCPSCLSLLQGSDTATCPVCGVSLKNPCPKCGCLLNPDDKQCTLCSCDITYSNAILTDGYRQIDKYLEKGKIHSAIMAINPLRIRFPHSKTVVEIDKMIECCEKQRDDDLKNAMDAYSSKNYYEAYVELSRFITDYPEDGSDYKGYLSDSNSHISDSNEHCTKSDNAQPECKLPMLLDASTACQDNPEVLKRLRSYPPSAPISVHTQTHVGCISIHIIPPADDRMVRFKIYRRISGEDCSSYIGTIRDTSYDDRTAVPGTVYEYDVFSERGLIRSMDCTSSNKSISISEVGNPHSSEDDGSMNLTFIKAEGSMKTVIHRISESGESTFNTDSDHFIDSNVNPGEKLTYTFRSVYRLDDTELMSDGVEITVSTKPIIPKITDLKITECREGFKAKWKCDADVVLYTTGDKNRKYIGVDLLSTFDRTLECIEPLHILNDGMIFDANKEGLFKIIPVSVVGHYGREGAGIEIANIKPFRKVTVCNHDGECTIRMDWPENASKAHISWVANGEERTECRDISEYSNEGFRIVPDTEGPVTFNIRAVYSLHNKDVESPPVSVQCYLGNRALVFYNVRNNRYSKKIVLRASMDSIPPVMAVTSGGGLPLTPFEGRTVWSTDGNIDLINGTATITVPFSSSKDNIRLFFKNIEDNNMYVLICENWRQ